VRRRADRVLSRFLCFDAGRVAVHLVSWFGLSRSKSKK
jgi:hypothetical protein